MVRHRCEPHGPPSRQTPQAQVCSSSCQLLILGSDFVTVLTPVGRLKQLKEGPYTKQEADAAGGLWVDNGRAGSGEIIANDIDMTT